MANRKSGKEKIVYLPIFVALGIALGLALIDDPGKGVSLGIAFGAGIGGLVDYLQSRQ